jgi:predicted 2-oxoglutarate/Fe(II)-dependent dioxygenase YbiX/peroxiredoxin
MARYRQLTPGDHAPWFRQACTSNPDYHFDTVGGRYVVLCFFLTAGDSLGQEMVATMESLHHHFDDNKITCFGISIDRHDKDALRVHHVLPGRRLFWDFDGRVSRLYGALPDEPPLPEEASPPDEALPPGTAGLLELPLRRFWLLLNPNLQVRAVIPAAPAAEVHQRLEALLAALPPLDAYAGPAVQAPVLVIGDVLEPELCQRLMALYEREGGIDSGFMSERNGKTVGLYNYGHKRRSDHTIADPELTALLRQRVVRRVLPLIERAYQFKVTRMERYIVACYDSAVGGHFRPHRDDTTAGTAHRKFAMSLNLNDDYDGAEISFPEFGPRTYRAPAGAAVVFSGSLLHAVTPVTRGRRYVFLPFLYDDAAAAQRAAANATFLDPSKRYAAT